MRRKLRDLPSFFLALHHQINCHHTTHHVEHHLHSLSLHRTITTSENIFKSTASFTPSLSNYSSSKPSIFSASFSSSVDEHQQTSDAEREFESDDDESEVMDCKMQRDPVSYSFRDLETLTDILQTGSAQQKSKKLEQCGVKATSDIVKNVISRTRNDWETAFTFFLWAGKQPNYDHSVREYHSMISILGKFRKYDTAWSLIDDMRAASLVTPRTLMIMIRKYAAVHDVGKAISAFYAHKKFRFEIRMEEFQALLSALCRYKNVKDAEHLLFCNITAFPLNTKSFNIILNGWCNVIGSISEGDRIWREMDRRGIRHDVYSYASIMTCQSKAGNLKRVLRLSDMMKVKGIEPDRKVYHAVIHTLAKGRHVKEARDLMKTMEEKGFKADAITYNSLIMPLCKYRLLDDAKQVFDEMVERRLFPTDRTYHAFFRGLRTVEEVFELLQIMYKSGCHPRHDTYNMLIRKFCRWRQIENVFKLWDGMKKNGLDPDRSSYTVLIHGLFLNGKLEEAHKYYLEMKEKDLLPEPRIDEMMQAWVASKIDSEGQSTDLKENQSNGSRIRQKNKIESKKNHRDNDLFRKPELRSVIRERGFSFWDH